MSGFVCVHVTCEIICTPSVPTTGNTHVTTSYAVRILNVHGVSFTERGAIVDRLIGNDPSFVIDRPVDGFDRIL